jgi:hypothetical protein
MYPNTEIKGTLTSVYLFVCLFALVLWRRNRRDDFGCNTRKATHRVKNHVRSLEMHKLQSLEPI